MEWLERLGTARMTGPHSSCGFVESLICLKPRFSSTWSLLSTWTAWPSFRGQLDFPESKNKLCGFLGFRSRSPRTSHWLHSIGQTKSEASVMSGLGKLTLVLMGRGAQWSSLQTTCDRNQQGKSSLCHTSLPTCLLSVVVKIKNYRGLLRERMGSQKGERG